MKYPVRFVHVKRKRRKMVIVTEDRLNFPIIFTKGFFCGTVTTVVGFWIGKMLSQ